MIKGLTTLALPKLGKQSLYLKVLNKEMKVPTKILRLFTFTWAANTEPIVKIRITKTQTIAVKFANLWLLKK